jgi:hypothetical protein
MEQTESPPTVTRPRLQSRSSRIRKEVALLAETENTAISDEHDNMLCNLEDDDEQVCLEAMNYFRVLEPSVIAMHSAAVAAKLKDVARPQVRFSALSILERLEHDMLAEHAAAIAAALNDADQQVRGKAANVLDRLRCELVIEKVASPALVILALSRRPPREVNAAVELAKVRGKWAIMPGLLDLLLHDDGCRKPL